MLPVLNRHPVPDWLMALRDVNDQIPIADVLRGSVFYPASAMDGQPLLHLAGFSHSFVYADWNISQDTLIKNLKTFKGYRCAYSRPVTRAELCFKSFQPILPSRKYTRGEDVNPKVFPYALWAIYDRNPQFGEEHGPERFSLLFVGGEGVATFQSLCYSNQCTPSVVVIIRSDGFTGNWTSFFRHEDIFAQSVMQNQYGTPDYLFCEYGEIRKGEEKSPWPWYPKLKRSVSFRGDGGRRIPERKLHLWQRDPSEGIAFVKAKK